MLTGSPPLKLVLQTELRVRSNPVPCATAASARLTAHANTARAASTASHTPSDADVALTESGCTESLSLTLPLEQALQQALQAAVRQLCAEDRSGCFRGLSHF